MTPEQIEKLCAEARHRLQLYINRMAAQHIRRMRQTRICSLVEACINVLIGFTINFFANILILPLIGFNITAGQNIFIGVLYTIVSVARSYAIRRWFNARLHAAAQAIAVKVA